MSAVLKRKPVPQDPRTDLREIPQTEDDDTQALRSAIPFGITVEGSTTQSRDAHATSPGPDDGTLVLSKEKVEELAYLLLGLVGKTPKNGFASQRETDRDSLTESTTESVVILPQNTGPKRAKIVVQEMLKPSEGRPEQISQSLFTRKPWSHERIVVEILKPGATLDVQDVHTDIGALDDTENESFPLTSISPSAHMDARGILKENSLYMLHNNHAWIDLHDRLGPGKFTDVGRDYWLSRRSSGSWPNVVPPPKRISYLIHLWDVLMPRNIRPDPRYSIVSDLARETDLSRMYRHFIASRIFRRVTSKTVPKSRRSKTGLLSKTATRLTIISRALFRTADSARSKLPSTLYLRMLGQSLFTSCLPVDTDDHGEKLLRILIASIPILTNKNSPGRDGTGTPKANVAMTASQATRLDGTITVWDTLAYCYRVGVLEQPAPEDVDGLWEHIGNLFSALQLVNVFTSRLDEKAIRSLPQDELLSSRVESICTQFTLRQKEPLYPSSTAEYFGKKELSIKTLQDVGALNILWTRHIDDHLVLDTNFSELRIFWPAWALANLPCSGLFSPYPVSEVLQDLLATYSFLFYSPDGLYAAVGDYRRLDPPSWLASMSTSLSEVAKARSLVGDLRYHFASYAHTSTPSQFGSVSNEQQNMIRFDASGIFENRTRILKGYMDSQKPSGLMALWRDRRDSGQWYTFWLVSIVGGISIILGMASLAVGIAQTVASFEALHYQIASNNVSKTSATSRPTSGASLAHLGI